MANTGNAEIYKIFNERKANIENIKRNTNKFNIIFSTEL